MSKLQKVTLCLNVFWITFLVGFIISRQTVTEEVDVPCIVCDDTTRVMQQRWVFGAFPDLPPCVHHTCMSAYVPATHWPERYDENGEVRDGLLVVFDGTEEE